MICISLVKWGNLQPGQGAFGHNVGGYDAGYYGYIFAPVYHGRVRDSFKKDPLGAALEKLYWDKNLLVGGSREETTT
ncbi:hypothetical protein M405DRAFT_811435 [Rhizopogon salebrosus TDB-379]|nr:hypothetical protein M405DRAFT_811435 [Rhizopogon salebrosus TDB-379]